MLAWLLCQNGKKLVSLAYSRSFMGLRLRLYDNSLASVTTISWLRTCGQTHTRTTDVIQKSHLLVLQRGLHIKELQKKPKEETSLKLSDKVPPGYELIYDNDLKNWIWGFYLTQPFLIGLYLLSVPYIPDLLNILDATSINIFYLTQIIAASLITYANLLCRRHVIRIYLNPSSGQFIATRRTILGALRTLSYTLADVACKPQANQDISSMVKIKHRPFSLCSEFFFLPEYYNMHITGLSSQYKSLERSKTQEPEF